MIIIIDSDNESWYYPNAMEAYADLQNFIDLVENEPSRDTFLRHMQENRFYKVDDMVSAYRPRAGV